PAVPRGDARLAAGAGGHLPDDVFAARTGATARSRAACLAADAVALAIARIRARGSARPGPGARRLLPHIAATDSPAPCRHRAGRGPRHPTHGGRSVGGRVFLPVPPHLRGAGRVAAIPLPVP